MIRYKIYQNKQKKGMNAGKWFARAVCSETYDLDKLSEHMSGHNSPYSLGVIRGVFTDMVRCIKELLLDGKSVKIDDLAIFSVGIRSKGTDTSESFTVDKNITGVRLRARATGILSSSNLNLASQLRQQSVYLKPGDEKKQPGGNPTGGQPLGGDGQPAVDPHQPVVNPHQPAVGNDPAGGKEQGGKEPTVGKEQGGDVKPGGGTGVTPDPTM